MKPALLSAWLCASGACQSDPIAVVQAERTNSAAQTHPGSATARVPLDRAGFIAVVNARFEVEVVAKVGGRIVELPVALGDAVAMGEPVALLDDPDLRLAAEAATSNVRVARAELTGAQHTRRYNRAQLRDSENLGDHVAASERSRHRHDLQRASALAKAAIGEVDASRVEAERLRTRLEALTLRAPFAAEVAAVSESPGQLVAPGAAIMRLVSAERIVRFAADAEAMPDIRIGAAIEFAADDGPTTWLGTVTAVAPEIDSARMVLVEAALVTGDDPPMSPPTGATGRVRVVADR